MTGVAKPGIYSPNLLPNDSFEWVQCPHTEQIFLKWESEPWGNEFRAPELPKDPRFIRYIRWMEDDYFLFQLTAGDTCEVGVLRIDGRPTFSSNVYIYSGHKPGCARRWTQLQRNADYFTQNPEAAETFIRDMLSNLRGITKGRRKMDLILDGDVPTFSLDQLEGGIPPYLLKYRGI